MVNGPNHSDRSLLVKLDLLLHQFFQGIAEQPRVDDRGEDWRTSSFKVCDGSNPLARIPREIVEAAVSGSEPDRDWIRGQVQAGLDALERAADWDRSHHDPETWHWFGLSEFGTYDKDSSGAKIEVRVKNLTANTRPVSVWHDGWVGDPSKADLQRIVDQAKAEG